MDLGSNFSSVILQIYDLGQRIFILVEFFNYQVSLQSYLTEL